MTTLSQEIGSLRRIALFVSLGRSPRIAKVRVNIKRRLRRLGHSFPSDISTRDLITLARTS